MRPAGVWGDFSTWRSALTTSCIIGLSNLPYYYIIWTKTFEINKFTPWEKGLKAKMERIQKQSVAKCAEFFCFPVLVWRWPSSVLIKMSGVTNPKDQCFLQHVRLWMEKTRHTVRFHYLFVFSVPNQQCIISLLNSGFPVNNPYESVIINKFIVHGNTSVSFLKDSADWKIDTGVCFICYKNNRRQTWRNTLQTFDHEFHEAEMW